MSNADRQQRRRLEKAAAERGLDPKDVQKLDDQDLERLENAQDVDNELAQRLQPSLGNQAVRDMMSNQRAQEAAQAAELEILEEEEEEYAEELIEEVDQEGASLDSPRLGGGGGSGTGDPNAGGAPGQMPWEQDMLFGDDDEDDDPQPRRRRTRPSARGTANQVVGPYANEDESQLLDQKEFEHIDDRLSAMAARAKTDRSGDARYMAVEMALSDPRRLARQGLDPESLIDRTGAQDPIGRPTAMGRFLGTHAEGLLARSVARLLGRAMSSLAPEAGGHAGAVARLSGLAVSTEALEGGGARTDRAVQIALLHDAWPEAIGVARQLGIESLRAPLVFDGILALRKLPPPPPDPGHRPRPWHLDLAALTTAVPPGPVPVVPRLDLAPAPPAAELTEALAEELAAVDAILARFTGGADPADLPIDPVISRDQLIPVLKAVDQLLSALGRTQVEAAAAAGAAYRIHHAPLRPVLEELDRHLRSLARQTVNVARKLQRFEGAPLLAVRGQPEAQAARLTTCVTRFLELRTSCLEQLAGAMDA